MTEDKFLPLGSQEGQFGEGLEEWFLGESATDSLLPPLISHGQRWNKGWLGDRLPVAPLFPSWRTVPSPSLALCIANIHPLP